MNANETASLIAMKEVLKDQVAEWEARAEEAADLLRTHFQTPGYVDTKALAVVSEVLAVLAGEGE